jgi:hypothetical protein
MIITITTITSCKDKDKMFKFETKIVNDLEVKLNEPFSIYVKTTNISGKDFNYEGSSTIVGATIYLKKGSTIIRPQDVPVTKDFRKMTFKKNDSIEKIWNFEYDLIKEKGCYDLYIEFFDQQEIFKNYICL